jgi:hypothetical protein
MTALKELPNFWFHQFARIWPCAVNANNGVNRYDLTVCNIADELTPYSAIVSGDLFANLYTHGSITLLAWHVSAQSTRQAPMPKR